MDVNSNRNNNSNNNVNSNWNDIINSNDNADDNEGLIGNPIGCPRVLAGNLTLTTSSGSTQMHNCAIRNLTNNVQCLTATTATETTTVAATAMTTIMLFHS